MSTQLGARSTADEVLSGVNLAGKRIFITGVSSGIGRETARSLVSHGANVVGTVRDLAKAAALTGGGSFELIELDLASLQSIRAGAEKLLTDGRRFDAIIANALINRIAPLLTDKGRLVVLSSQAHRVADVDLEDPNFERQAYDPFVAYGRSKTANSLYAVEFDRRHRDRGIRAAAVMPGNSLTDLPRHFSQEQLQGLFETVGNARKQAGLPPPQLNEIPQAAATSVWAAVVADGNEIGGKYLEDCAVAPVNDTPNPFADGVRSYALDAGKARQLWEKSEELLGARQSD
jgi:NAD(P)-dependent dehydrogenase (short-subunit alcohol dehydrogenase family)